MIDPQTLSKLLLQIPSVSQKMDTQEAEQIARQLIPLLYQKMQQIRVDPVRFLSASQIVGRMLKENPDQRFEAGWDGVAIFAQMVSYDRVFITTATSMDPLTPLSVAMDRLAEKLVNE